METIDYPLWAWLAFTGFVLTTLAIDLGVLNRKAHVPSYREASIWSAVWISLALTFSIGVFYYLGTDSGTKFITGYIIELSLSVDNLFVFLLIFSYFKVPAKYQHRVLFWGVLGALVMRAIMIFIGAALIERFEWILYLFGGFLVITGLKMFKGGETEVHPEQSIAIRVLTRFIPVTHHYEEEKFFTRINGRLHGTLMLLVLVMVEMTDLVFAVDSIPAIFAITTDPFIVYTSNVFAIMGLRSLYFLLSGMVQKFYYLKIGLAIVLTFIGIKMLIREFIHLPIEISLLVVAGTLGASVLASILWPKATDMDVEVDVPTGFTDEIEGNEPGGNDSSPPKEMKMHKR
jgi:tellurite resistance protein TerC